MNLAYFQNLLVTGASAYFFSNSIRDSRTRPDTFATLLLSEKQTCDYLKKLKQRAISEDDDWLAERLARHAKDEKQHCQFFAGALERLEYEICEDLNSTDLGTTAFYVRYYEGYSLKEIEAENVDWATFFASTYVVEIDGYRDMRIMAQALPNESNYRYLTKGLLKVASDEREHARYLYQALCRCTNSENQAKKLVEKWKVKKTKAVMALIEDSIKQAMEGKKQSLTRPVKFK